jgi:hypothetical protein
MPERNTRGRQTAFPRNSGPEPSGEKLENNWIRRHDGFVENKHGNFSLQIDAQESIASDL